MFVEPLNFVPRQLMGYEAGGPEVFRVQKHQIPKPVGD